MGREYLGKASPYFTPADEQLGYPETRKRLAGYTDADLIKEYHAMSRASVGVFGRNAARFGNLIVAELLSRGITETPNLFGPISVRHISVP